MNNGKNALLKQIQALSLAKVETELFLDTHPECKMALNYYKATLEKLSHTAKAFITVEMSMGQMIER